MDEMVNVENCRKLARAIEERAKYPDCVEEPLPTPMPAFYMPVFVMGNVGGKICNTVGCIAGSAVALFDPTEFSAAMSNSIIRDRAKSHLGLNYYQTEALFAPTVNHNLVTAKHAVAMLDWLADNPEAVSCEIRDHWFIVVGYGEVI